jgi:hypothetical protein
VKTVWLKATKSEATGIAAPPMRAGASRTLASNGRWVVPPEERPAGWQSLRVSEAADNARVADSSANRAAEAA